MKLCTHFCIQLVSFDAEETQDWTSNEGDASSGISQPTRINALILKYSSSKSLDKVLWASNNNNNNNGSYSPN